MKIVLFLGAGYSAAFGYPVMNTFQTFVDSCSRVSDAQRAFLADLVLDARRANSFLESSPSNLEDILSFAVMGDRLGLHEAEPRGPAVRKVLERVCTSLPEGGSAEYWKRFDAVERFLGFRPGEAHELSIVTTNYDLNAEAALHRLGSSGRLPFEVLPIRSDSVQVVGHLYSDSGVPLYKLHGSVNWYESASAEAFEVDGRIVAVQGPIGASAGAALPRVCTANFNTERDPSIIPPSYLKPELTGPLAEVWGGAANVLSEASVVVFVGYSFPKSDTEMMYFLARSLAENAGLRAIKLVSPDASRIVEGLRAVGSRFGSHFKELLEPIDSQWETTSLALA